MTTQEIQDKIDINTSEITKQTAIAQSASSDESQILPYLNGCKKRDDECRTYWGAKMTEATAKKNTANSIVQNLNADNVSLRKALSDASEADKTVKTTLAEQGKTMESVATAAQADAVVTVQKGAADIKNDNKKKNVKLILGFSAGAIVLVVAVILIIRKLRKKKQQ